MDNTTGVCLFCGMAVNLPHTCSDDHRFLGVTDWQIRRYQDQVELGVTTSLTPAEYQQMQLDRQAARERISAQE
jgi:hypothetical protein